MHIWLSTKINFWAGEPKCRVATTGGVRHQPTWAPPLGLAKKIVLLFYSHVKVSPLYHFTGLFGSRSRPPWKQDTPRVHSLATLPPRVIVPQRCLPDPWPIWEQWCPVGCSCPAATGYRICMHIAFSDKIFLSFSLINSYSQKWKIMFSKNNAKCLNSVS
jgi:hypothetical protein